MLNKQLSDENGLKNSIRNLINILFKRKGLILLVFLTILSVITVNALLMKPKFKANSKILLERDFNLDKALLFGMNLSRKLDTYDWINSEVEIIKSYPVTERVVMEMGIGVPSDLESTPGPKEMDGFIEKGVVKFQRNMNVTRPRQSNIINLSYVSSNPGRAAKIVNKVIETYLHYRLEIYNELDSFNFFEEQMKITDGKLRDLEQQQSAYKNRETMLSLESYQNILQAKLSDYEKALTSVQRKRIGKVATYEVMKEQLAAGSEAQIPMVQLGLNPNREKHFAKLKERLLEKQIERNRLIHEFKPTSAEIKGLDREIAAIKGELENEIKDIMKQEEAAIKALRSEERALERFLNSINQEIRAFSQKEKEFNQISRGIEGEREVYSVLLKQREEARISMAKRQRGVKVKIISPAIPSSEPEGLSKKAYIVLGILFGLIGGLGLAFIVEYFDDSIETVDELEQVVRLPSLGEVTEFKVRN